MYYDIFDSFAIQISIEMYFGQLNIAIEYLRWLPFFKMAAIACMTDMGVKSVGLYYEAKFKFGTL